MLARLPLKSTKTFLNFLFEKCLFEKCKENLVIFYALTLELIKLYACKYLSNKKNRKLA